MAHLRVDTAHDTVTLEMRTKASVRPGESTALSHLIRPLRDVASLPQATRTGIQTHASNRLIAQDDEIPMVSYGRWGSIEEAPGEWVWMGPQNSPDSQDGLWLDYFEMRPAE